MCAEQLVQWEQFCKQICTNDRMKVVKEFQATNPSIWDWDQELQRYRQVRKFRNGFRAFSGGVLV